MAIRGEIFSTKIVLDKRSYFFNVKENRMGDIFLNIVESKKSEEGDGFDRHSVVLFSDDVQPFLKGFEECLSWIEKELSKKAKASHERKAARRERPEGAAPGSDEEPQGEAAPRPKFSARKGEGDAPRGAGPRPAPRPSSRDGEARPYDRAARHGTGAGRASAPRAGAPRTGASRDGRPSTARPRSDDRPAPEGKRASRAAPRKDSFDSRANPPREGSFGARAGFADKKGLHGDKPRKKVLKAGPKSIKKTFDAKAPKSLVKKVVKAKKKDEAKDKAED